MHLNRLLRFIGLGLVGAGLPLACVHAETVNCTAITSLPSTITVQGVYCFTADLTTAMTSGNAIEIQTNNVTIDLNGHKLGGQAVGPATFANGIYALNGRNITLKNGSIRGFFHGVLLEDTSSGFAASGGHVLEGLRADGNTFVGFTVEGRGNLIRNNQVVNTGGSTSAYGIQVLGPGVRVLNNDVIGTAASCPPLCKSAVATGISVSTAADSVIENNRISETTYNAPSSGVVSAAYGINVFQGDASSISGNRIAIASANSYGINLASSSSLTVRDNSISGMATGISFNSSTGVYMGNLVYGATTFYSGGSPAGTNYP